MITTNLKSLNMKKHLLYIFLIASQIAFADVRLPSIFTDHMVLQQKSEVKLWGWSDPDEEIVITPSWSATEYKVKGSNQAYWETIITTPSAGGPFTISINGNNTLILNDILIGEVWLCSGQSNMEMSAAWGIENGDEEVKTANQSTIRFYTAPKISAKFPQLNIVSQWEVCSPISMKKNSALAYFFAKRLQEVDPDVPVGLIISAWGGTPAETWMPEEVINNDTLLLKTANSLKPVPWGPVEPARTFNAMINPLIDYTIAGALWYQGEANVGSNNYTHTLTALIKSWRDLWKNDFPFYIVQIAPYQYGENNFNGAIIRDAQRIVSMEIPNTDMVVTSDISTIDDIHPKDKKTVGIRLANLALTKHYKKNNDLVNGPSFKKISVTKNKVNVYFDYAEGLYFSNKQLLFEVAGDDGEFYHAKAKIFKETIKVSSKKVKHPTKVRFAWGNTVQSNLFNKANLPASTFITK